MRFVVVLWASCAGPQGKPVVAASEREQQPAKRSNEGSGQPLPAKFNRFRDESQMQEAGASFAPMTTLCGTRSCANEWP